MRKKEGMQQGDLYINLTPIVDVALILVIIFLCVCPMALITGIRTLEAKSGAGKGKTAKEDNVQVILKKDSSIVVNNRSVEKKDLASAIRESISKSKTGVVTLTADKANRVNDVVEILDISKQQGAKKVIIMRKAE